MRLSFVPALTLTVALAGAAHATEYYIGDPVTRNGLSVGAAYLTGIEMEPMPPLSMGDDTIHLECDVSAAEGNEHGFEAGRFVPYLTCSYLIEKVGTDWRHAGTMLAMVAQDGPHYANNVPMDGPGEYRVAYFLEPPSRNGFFRHADEETGVPAWWEPFSVAWTFEYPSRPVEE